MFSPDIISLRQFYTTPLGEEARRYIAASLHELWPAVAGDNVLGIGFCTPYLDPYLSQGSVFACMPAQQGAAYWPPAHANLVFLSGEGELPLPENSINRVLLMHSVENSEQLSWMMKEIWRVLTPGGRVLAVVPNRHGMWSRSSRTPFGYGRPFSMMQLRDLLVGHQFTLTRYTSTLFLPPYGMRALRKIAPYAEKTGKLVCRIFGGVLLIEAEKQIYAAVKQPVVARQPMHGVAAT